MTIKRNSFLFNEQGGGGREVPAFHFAIYGRFAPVSRAYTHNAHKDTTATVLGR